MSHPPPAGATAPPPAPARPAAWREAADRLRAAATTEPGRLRIIGAVLAAVLVAFGAVTAWQVTDRAAAADAVVRTSQPLSADAADIYRSLADADTTAASGFLAGGQEPHAVRQRYEKDVALASRLLVKAAANTEGSETSRRQITRLNELLPQYTGLVEAARANNRQGLPLGGAYLRNAGDRMRTELLPAARQLYEAETGRLGSDYADAESWPWAALATGVLALAVLGWAQRRTYRRTHRVFNHGMLAGTAAATVVLLWLVVGHAVARSDLEDSFTHGAQSLQVLNEARIGSLQARGDENLTLVARGSVLTKNGDDAYEAAYGEGMRKLIGGGSSSGEPSPGTLLERARKLADDPAGRDPVDAAIRDVREWQGRHGEARAADDSGLYEKALPKVIGEKGSTGESFDRVDQELSRALAHEQREFDRAADDGRGALSGLAAGAAVLGVLGAAGAVMGIGRRLSEYR
ncbi:hypothetical protein [Streptomyces sp. ISL-11]|uniref:hypothetical protein n=1 Tax=Streptomyces sp. ISL-11 TaxID=2819174 RepID=UPI001BE6E703|nr:hypothetical protein [Streptomyces sp. ISL-11]MBT2385389.1 hypothetical protein [Streptomyces sp. ISL-11]